MKNCNDWKINFSMYLSYLLRHHPEELDLNMDNSGWVAVDELLAKLCKTNENLTFETLKNIVDMNSKKRFALKVVDNKYFIRASQGHSIKTLNLGLTSKTPPDVLYHGTGLKYVNSILKQGLRPKSRQHVHLSSTLDVAYSVGSRHGEVRIFKVDSLKMRKDGVVFYLSENNVWLTDFVDKKYLILL